MNALLNLLDRISVGALAVTGLALFVLAVLATPFSGTLPTALAAAALAVWLAALAAFISTRFAELGDRDRTIAAGTPIAIALVFAVVAVATATGIGASGAGKTTAEDVAGVTGGPTAAIAASPSPAAASPSDAASVAPTDTPSAEPSPTLHHGRVAIEAIYITSPVSPGDTARVTVTTSPWEPCSISVSYPGAAGTSGLEPTVSDGSGSASWTWTVAAGAPSGTWPVRVTCANGGWAAWNIVAVRIR